MFKVELVKYDTEKTQKRKRKDLLVELKSEESVIEKLEKIHKKDKVVKIYELVWGEEQVSSRDPGNLLTGNIKFFDAEKGFGFIQPDEEMDDLFFHVSALGGQTLEDGDLVEFESSEGPKGLIAIHIKRIEEEW